MTLRFAAFGLVPLFGEFVTGYCLSAMNRQRWVMLISLVGAGINLALDLLLIPWFGLIGACLGLVGAHSLTLLLALALIRRGACQATQPWDWETSTRSL